MYCLSTALYKAVSVALPLWGLAGEACSTRAPPCTPCKLSWLVRLQLGAVSAGPKKRKEAQGGDSTRGGGQGWVSDGPGQQLPLLRGLPPGPGTCPAAWGCAAFLVDRVPEGTQLKAALLPSPRKDHRAQVWPGRAPWLRESLTLCLAVYREPRGGFLSEFVWEPMGAWAVAALGTEM